MPLEVRLGSVSIQVAVPVTVFDASAETLLPSSSVCTVWVSLIRLLPCRDEIQKSMSDGNQSSQSLKDWWKEILMSANFNLYLHKFVRKGKHEISCCRCLGDMFEIKELKENGIKIKSNIVIEIKKYFFQYFAWKYNSDFEEIKYIPVPLWSWLITPFQLLLSHTHKI